VNASGGDGSDIGAYEAQTNVLQGCGPLSLIVTNNNDSGVGSLRNILTGACGGETITFAPNVTGAIALTGGELLINRIVTINGPGAGVLTVRRSDVAGNFRIFQVTSKATISGLTIAKGVAPSAGGGGILNFGKLSISDCVLTLNSANNGGGGGGILNYGALVLTNSTVSLNVATDGGGIRNGRIVAGGGTPMSAFIRI